MHTELTESHPAVIGLARLFERWFLIGFTAGAVATLAVGVAIRLVMAWL